MDQPANRDVEALHERMLRKQLWVIISKRVASPEEVRKHLKAHLEHQISLEKQGIMYGAGPATAPGENEPAFGLIIIRASRARKRVRSPTATRCTRPGCAPISSINGR